MRLERHPDAAAFLRRAGDYLGAREAEHNLLLGLSGTLVGNPNAYGSEPPYLVTLEADGGHVTGAALRTLPFNLLLSALAPDADVPAVMALLAADVNRTYGASLPGVSGPAEPVRAFAAEWQRLTGQPATLADRERIYQLDAVVPVEGVPGTMRRANEADRPLLARWMAAFEREALGHEEVDGQAWVGRMFTQPGATVWLWEVDGTPVTMVATHSPTPRGIRLGPVYTPPVFRRHGYASACTAGATQHALERGRQFVFLYTDLANPTSNKIYQAIGYRPVSDVEVYRFGTAAHGYPEETENDAR